MINYEDRIKNAQEWIKSDEGQKTIKEGLSQVQEYAEETKRKRQLSNDDLLKPVTL